MEVRLSMPLGMVARDSRVSETKISFNITQRSNDSYQGGHHWSLLPYWGP